VSRIWVPNAGGSGLLKLALSDQSTASPECTFDDVLDSDTFHLCGSADRRHTRTLKAIEAMERAAQIKERAKRLTAEAVERAKDAPRPGVRAVRAIEADVAAAAPTAPRLPPSDIGKSIAEKEQATYEDMMTKLLAAQDDQ
jgi:hypothetical protein